MWFRRRTLSHMDPEIERLLARVAQIVEAQGGDWEHVEAQVRSEFSGPELMIPDGDRARAQLLMIMLLYEYEELGPKVVRGWFERRRHLLPTAPARSGWGWRATG